MPGMDTHRITCRGWTRIGEHAGDGRIGEHAGDGHIGEHAGDGHT
ncbi:unnamed protein product [Staurois parvus]|uniref:Uncharacterized protein n=1 Tax=Staurois parvus TaxID=386267 RepID=A0ABN9D2U7_9NEOB|nr:unnamed protein product [Staurois parvus]